MIEYELTHLLITIAILVVSLVSLGTVIVLNNRMTPKVYVYAWMAIGPESLSTKEDEKEFYLELTARNNGPFAITVTGFYAELSGRQFGDPHIPIEGSCELAMLESEFPCRLDQGDRATRSRLVRDDLIDLSDPKQVEYFVATDSCGRSWKTHRWPLKKFLPRERVIDISGWDKGHYLINRAFPDEP
jgi:hypothetical protein